MSYNKYYNNKIQTDITIINDINMEFTNIKDDNKKMLVFGLGYDSELWYNMTNKNTYFVEDNPIYINLVKNIIPINNIFHYKYNTKVKDSFNYVTNKSDKIPDEILNNGPYNIIYIDGPAGYNDMKCGRLLPIYWSQKYLSNKCKTIIYIDDCNRKLEAHLINKYFNTSICNKTYNYTKHIFNVRDGCMKIVIN